MIEATGVIGRLTSKDRPVNIVGAGLCGLILAYQLQRKGFQVKLYERLARAGGKIGTFHHPEGIVETAANGIYSSPEVLALLKDLDLPYLTAEDNLKRLFFRDGTLRSFPLYWHEVFRILPRLFKQIPQGKDISLKDFFSPLLGEKLCKECLQLAMNGIYATPIDQLHFESIFKLPRKKETYLSFFRRYRRLNLGGGKTISFEMGMQSLVTRLEKKLAGNIFYDQMGRIEGTTIICTDAPGAAEILRDKNPQLAQLLSEIDYTTLGSFTAFPKEELTHLKGAFGALYPYSEDAPLGILNNKAIFPTQSPSSNPSYTAITKGKNPWPEILGEEQTKSYQVHWERALPIYNLKRAKLIKKLRSLLYNQEDILLFGNYVDGISLRQMIKHIHDFTQATELSK